MHCLKHTLCMNNICDLFQLWCIFLFLPDAQTLCGVRGAEFKSHKQLPTTNKLHSLFTHTHTEARARKRYERQCSGPNPISTSRFITPAGRAKKTPAGGQGERRKIDIPILPCLLHWPPTLSHIIAADTGKTNDSRVRNMGGECEGPRQ